MRASELITVNQQLNPKIWQGRDLKPEVREKLMAIARAFREFIGVDIDVTDVTVTGSNANFNWTAYSDLDLHLIIPGTPTDNERELYSAKKALWGEQRDIRIKGLPVECYVQGQEEEHHSTGVYSVAKNKWLVEPSREQPKTSDSAVTQKHQELAWLVGAALDSRDLDALRRIKDKITTMRKSGLERAGEFSVENLVFKLLRNQGLIDRLTLLIRDLEDHELSLEQQTTRT
jgi:predicted nucleotidyltransferase